MPITYLVADEVEWLQTLVTYESDTGLFRWKIYTRGRGGEIRPGDIAGTAKDGYIQIKVGGYLWRAHRLAWVFMTGELPPKGKEIDHRDRDRANNKWSNLRLLTRSHNNHNAVPMSRNKSGVRGVSWDKQRSRWDARITIEGTTRLLGYYEQLNNAIAARRDAEKYILE